MIDLPTLAGMLGVCYLGNHKSSGGGAMRATGYLLVSSVFVAVALVTYAVIRAIGWEANDLALVVAAIAASQLGTFVWYRQAPESSERSVKLGLGTALSITAVAFAVIFQAISGWLEYPMITVAIAAIGCFVFPFGIVGPFWKALAKGKPPESKDSAEPLCDLES